MNIELPAPAATDRLGRTLAAALEACTGGAVITLTGELGAGKTALARAVIRALGHAGPVVSPSYTLVESYDLALGPLHHLDLYRLTDPEELEFLGIRDVMSSAGLVFVEWAEHGAGFLPPADLDIALEYVDHGRLARLSSCSETGRRLVMKLQGAASDATPDRTPQLNSNG